MRQTITTDKLKILINYLDTFDEFSKELKNLIQKYPKKDIPLQIELLSKEKDTIAKKHFIPQDIKEFYEKHKDLFRTIKESYEKKHPTHIGKVTIIKGFLIDNYNQNDGSKKDTSFHRFYEYLKENEDSLDNISALVEKMAKLDIDEITLDKKANFTTQQHSLPSQLENYVYYFEDTTIVPTYHREIEYKTNSSRYQIKQPLVTHQPVLETQSTSITLTTLNIPIMILPEELNPNQRLEELKEMKKEDLYRDIEISCALASAIEDYEDDLFMLTSRLRNLHQPSIGEGLEQAISLGNEVLRILKNQRAHLDSSILTQYSTQITKERLSEEQKSYRKQVLLNRHND